VTTDWREGAVTGGTEEGAAAVGAEAGGGLRLPDGGREPWPPARRWGRSRRQDGGSHDHRHGEGPVTTGGEEGVCGRHRGG
jgi:hypothetical protein